MHVYNTDKEDTLNKNKCNQDHIYTQSILGGRKASFHVKAKANFIYCLFNITDLRTQDDAAACVADWKYRCKARYCNSNKFYLVIYKVGLSGIGIVLVIQQFPFDD